MRLTKYWIERQATFLMVYFPREANIIEALQVWHRYGIVHRWEIVTSWHGDLTARNRSVVVVANGVQFDPKVFLAESFES